MNFQIFSTNIHPWAKVPMFTWSTLVGPCGTLNLDRPAENEARASNKTLWAFSQKFSVYPNKAWSILFIASGGLGEWLIRSAPTWCGVGGGSVVQFWRAGSSSQQTPWAPLLGSSMTPGPLLVSYAMIGILTCFRTPSERQFFTVQRLECSCDNSVKHLLLSTHFHAHTLSACRDASDIMAKCFELRTIFILVTYISYVLCTYWY